MNEKELAAVGNGVVHIFRSLPHNEQLGLLMSLNEAVLSRHHRECVGLIIEDLLRLANSLPPADNGTYPTETNPMKIN